VANLTISEDSTMNYNKWVQGIAAREFSSQRVFLKDILGKTAENDQYPNNVIDNKILPYPLGNLIPCIGNTLFNLTNALSLLKVSNQNPLCDDKPNVGYVDAARSELNEAYKFIKRAIKHLDNISITAVNMHASKDDTTAATETEERSGNKQGNSQVKNLDNLKIAVKI